MAKEMIERIKAAEEAGAAHIEEAKAEAQRIVSDAKKEAAELERSGLEKAEADVKERLEKAENAAGEILKKETEDERFQRLAMKANLQSEIDDMVLTLVDRILK